MPRFYLLMLWLLAALRPSPVAAGPAQPPAVLVRFERTPCYGYCPVDVLTIYTDGRLCYQGQENAPRAGTYASRLSAAERQALQRAFEEAQFFELAPAYTSLAPDLPTYYLTYAAGGRQLKVADQDGAPARLKALEARLVKIIENPKGWRRARP